MVVRRNGQLGNVHTAIGYLCRLQVQLCSEIAQRLRVLLPIVNRLAITGAEVTAGCSAVVVLDCQPESASRSRFAELRFTT